MTSAENPFANANANVRDTAKWLSAVFASLAAVVIGGTPLSGLGSLPIHDFQFWVGAALLLAAFGCICGALWITLSILRPETTFRSDLYVDQRPPGQSSADWKELVRIRAIIDAHAADLLPDNYPQLSLIGRRIERCREVLRTPGCVGKSGARRLRSSLNARLKEPMQFAHYLRLSLRLRDALPRLILLGVGALVMLIAFGAVVASAREPQSKPSSSIIIMEPREDG